MNKLFVSISVVLVIEKHARTRHYVSQDGGDQQRKKKRRVLPRCVQHRALF